MLLQSGLSEPDKEENKATSESDDSDSREVVTSFLACINSFFCMMLMSVGILIFCGICC